MRLRLELASAPASVGLVRSVIRTVARAATLDRELIEDMLTSISEACNNAVLHAYVSSSPGPLIFSLAIVGEKIEAVVRDHGSGISAEPSRHRGLGKGIMLINSLAARAEFESSELGTEVRMRFGRRVEARDAADQVGSTLRALTDSRSSASLRARSD